MSESKQDLSPSQSSLLRDMAKREQIIGQFSIEQWLWGNKDSSTSAPPTLTIRTQGPGQMLKWRALRGRKEIFADATPPPPPPRKKILICAPLDGHFDVGEKAILSRLISDYEVYLWKGPQTKLLTAEKITSIDALCAQCATIQPATAKEITAFFDIPANQLSTSEWLILDKTAYDLRFGVPPHTLDLEGLDIGTLQQQERLLKSVDPATITRVNVYLRDLEQIKFIIKNFPRLKTLQLHNLSIEWLESNFKDLEGVENLIVAGMLLPFPNSKLPLRLRDAYGIKSLEFRGKYDVPSVQLAASATSSIKIVGDSRISGMGTTLIPGGKTKRYQHKYIYGSGMYDDYRNNPNNMGDLTLVSYVVQSRSDLNALMKSPQATKVENLEIQLGPSDFNGNKLATYFPNLRSLKFTAGEGALTPQIVEIPELKSLEFLELDATGQRWGVYLDTCPKLSTLHANGKVHTRLSDQPVLESIVVDDKAFFQEYEGWRRNYTELVSDPRGFQCLPKLKYFNLLLLPEQNTALPPAALSPTPPLPQEEKREFHLPVSLANSAIKGVCFYSIPSRSRVTAPTGTPGIVASQGDFQAVLKHDGKEVPLHEYRISFFEQITLTPDGRVVFESTLKNRNPASYTPIPNSKAAEFATHPYQGFLKGKLSYGIDYPLPLKGAVDKDKLSIYKISPQDANIGIFYDAEEQHYYVRLLSNTQKPLEVNLAYAFTPRAAYEKALTQKIELAETKFSPSLREKVDAFVNRFAKLKFLTDETLTPLEKIQRLAVFCQAFKDKKLQDQSHKPGSLEELFQIITEQRGACVHISQAFMLLARSIGVDARIGSNGVHFFCEVRDKDNNWIWAGELGGGAMIQNTKTDAEAFIREMTAAAEKPEAKTPEVAAAAAQPKTNYAPLISDYFNKKLPYDPKNASAARIQIEVEKDETKVHQTIKQVLAMRDPKKPYLVIYTAADFERYSKDIYWDEDHWAVKPGPLAEIRASGGDLYIDFTSFSKDEHKQFAELFKIPAVLGNQTFHQNTRIIAFTLEDTRLENCSRYTLPLEQNPAPIETKTVASPVSSEHIDLFHGIDWEERLVADLEFTATGPKPTEKIWRRCITQRTPLVIHRPPADPEFWRLYNQIKIEGRVRLDNSWVNVDPNLISITESPLNSAQITGFTCSPHTAEFKGDHIIIDRSNWHTLYEDLETDATSGYPKTIPGKLAQYADGDVVFYVTQQVEDWDRLAEFIRSTGFKKPFQFQLAPGITGPGVMSNDASPITTAAKPETKTRQAAKNLCYVSNDPVCLADVLQRECSAEEKAVILDVTPDMEATDLLACVETIPNVEEEKASDVLRMPRLRYTKGTLFQRLEQGETVIVQGCISPKLKQALLPALVGKPPYLEFNGKRQPISGRLILVEPKTATHTISWLPQIARDFSAAEYEVALLHGVPEAKDQQKIRDLMLFFEAAKYPHSGAAMPEDLGMCWERLRQMRVMLLAKAPPLHKHNPLKGLMWFDYAKNEEYYAFLNVLAKYLFDTDPDAPMRVGKYNRLLTQAGAHSQSFSWRLLNTLNGTALRRILGENWPRKKRHDFLFSTLTQELWPTFQTALAQEAAATTQSLTEAKSAPTPDNSDKALINIQRMLAANPFAKVLTLQGDPGVGKTKFLTDLQANPTIDCFNGLTAIGGFLAPRTAASRPRFLLLDEANTLAAHKLNMFVGIHRNPPVLFYQGAFHQLGPDDRIIAATNPEYFAGRKRHGLLRSGHTEYMQLARPDVLQRWLCEEYAVPADIAEKAIATAELYKNYRPNIGYSRRDLQSVMQRYLALKNAESSADDAATLYRALVGEFAVTLPSNVRSQFKNELAKKIGYSSEIAPPKEAKMVVIPELQDAYEALLQGRAIRQRVLSLANQKLDPRSAMLAYKGLLLQSPTHVNPLGLCREVFPGAVVVNATDPNFRKTAIAAQATQAPLIIRDVNLLKESHVPPGEPSNEKFMGALLTGLHPYTLQPIKRGCFIICLQNPPSENNDASTLSPAMVNRMQAIDVPALSPSSLATLAGNALGSAEEGSSFVEQFLRQNSARLETAMREFFSCLEYVCKKMGKATSETSPVATQGLFARVDSQRLRFIALSTLAGGIIPAAMWGGFLALQQLGYIASTTSTRVLFHAVGPVNTISIGLAAGLVFSALCIAINSLYQSRALPRHRPQGYTRDARMQCS